MKDFSWKLKLMLLFSVIGAFISLYIYYADTYAGGVVCPNAGCAAVAASQYSQLFGVPVAIWGFLYYVGITAIVMFKDIFKNRFNLLLGAGIVWGVIFTIYLRFVEFFYIKAICVWCWGSVLIIVSLLVLYLLQVRDSEK